MWRKYLVHNVCWNFAGFVGPILVAVVAIPPLILRLGDERFGVLAIGWMVMGYFVLSDFGIGRATTKYLSETRRELDVTIERDTIYTSMASHLGLGLVGGGLFAAFTPFVVRSAFQVSAGLQDETIAGFYWLAASIPVLLVTSCLRGILEAWHRFDLVNMLRIPTVSINYIVPLVILGVSNNLSHILAAMFVVRVVGVLTHYMCVLRVNPQIGTGARFSTDVVGALFRFGGWIAVSSLVTPVILFSDRIFVATLFGSAAVTYYVTPYEVVTKLWMFSASLLGALFPVLSVMEPRSQEVGRVARKAFIILFVLTAPAVGVLLAYGRDLLALWISPELAQHSGTVAKWLAVGVLSNILAQVPLTVLQATGKPEIVARIQVVQLPAYILGAWWLSRKFGTVGIAMAWAMRAAIELIFLQAAAGRWTGVEGIRLTRQTAIGGAILVMFLGTAWSVDTIWRFDVGPRTLVFGVVFVPYLIWQWRALLDPSDRLEIFKLSKVLSYVPKAP